MKRGRDEEKILGPMFPRLHVNDTEKGGPRAPPRNKMALYEQLSIPSQRFSNTAADWAPPSSQGGGNDGGMLFPTRHPSDKQYRQYSELSSPLAQVGQRKKKLEKDDFTVPVFIQSVPSKEFDKYSNNMVHVDQEELSSSNPPCVSNHSLKYQHSTKDEGKNKNGERSEAAISNSSFIENTERISSNLEKNLCSEDQNFVNDLSVETESHEDGSCRSIQTRNLERGDSVSETSMLETVSGLDITPDDIVGIIGRKHFWKARSAIANQQRVFAIQVFELHRLIKVQRSIAASPHLLQDDSAYLDKPSKAKKLPMTCMVKAIPNVSKPQKPDLDKQNHKKEASAENTVEKASLSSAQNRAQPPSSKPSSGNSSSPPSVISSEHNPNPWSFNQIQGHHQWLIPVMSPIEGLVYKPYPGPGFTGQACGGCGPPGPNPMMGSNFSTPAYGVPAAFPQHHFPPFPSVGPYGYFPPYGMPTMNMSAFPSPATVPGQTGPTAARCQTGPPGEAYGMPTMNTSASSGSAAPRQTDPTAAPGQKRPTGDGANFSIQYHDSSTVPSQKNGPVGDVAKTRSSEDLEVQASTTSSPSERRTASSATVEARSMLALFPSSTGVDDSNTGPEPGPERCGRVIKVVPHNALSASESAARIFRSIQEERKQYDSV